MPDNLAEDSPDVAAFRDEHAKLNGTAGRKSGADPRPSPPWTPTRREPAPLFDDAPTERMDHLVAGVQALIAAEREASRSSARTWAIAGVTALLLLCALVAWLGWLYLVHRGHA